MINKLDKKRLTKLFSRAGFSLVGVMVILATFALPSKPAQAATFDQNNLISNSDFIDVNSMSAAEIQNFLTSQGSFLQSYSEGGRSAAEIIYGAAHGYNEASGTLNGIVINSTTGTVNPKVILTTLQKEQSLITRTTQNDAALNAAMGYACPDSGGCNPNYVGFTKQVENASWQLRYNYERAQGTGFSDYQVGQTVTFVDCNTSPCSSHTVTFANRATSALYRYTPHVYNGNYNFWNLFFNTYQFQLAQYAASWYWQSPFNPGGTSQIVVAPGETANAMVAFKNNGFETWGDNLRLSVADDASAKFADSSWLSSYRIAATDNVETNGVAIYQFKLKAPSNLAPGTYYFKVELISENVTWLYNTATIFQVKVPTIQEQYNGSWYWQSPFNPGGTSQIVVAPGNTANAMVAFKNNGYNTWDDNTRLSVIDEASTKFADPSWISSYRIASSNNVTTGNVGIYQFKVKAPANLAPGTYYLKVELVDENNGVNWMYSTATFLQIKVPTIQEQYNGSWYWQSPFNPGSTSQIEISPGGTANAMVAFKNNGFNTWDDSVRLSVIDDASTRFADPSWLSTYRIQASSGTESGGVGIYQFKLKAPADLAPGTYYFKVEMVHDGTSMDWMYSTATIFQVKVQ